MEPAPLTWSAALTHWQWDTWAVLAVIVLSLRYGRAWRRCEALTRKHAWCFGITIVLLRLFSADERERATTVDAELEMAEAPSGLWWEHDPQLRDRMGRR
jgi:hypothetical protein